MGDVWANLEIRKLWRLLIPIYCLLKCPWGKDEHGDLRISLEFPWSSGGKKKSKQTPYAIMIEEECQPSPLERW